MTHPLDGCWAKIDRAKEHFDALQAEIAASNYRDHVSFRQQYDVQTNLIQIVVETVPDLPVRWALMAADSLQNFRASLNYLIWELARWNLARRGRVRDPRDSHQFPIVTEIGAPVPANRVIDLDPAHIAILERLQPNTRTGFSRVHPGVPPPKSDRNLADMAKTLPLAVLQELTNADEHRVLQFLYTTPGAITVRQAIGINCYIKRWRVGRSNPFKPGAVWAEYEVFPTSNSAQPEVQVQDEVTLEVGFEDGNSAVPTIRKIGGFVVGVIREFEPVF